MLHGNPDMKAVEYGDFVLMDYGCKYNGYTADITRTVVVGKATGKQKEVYQYVKEMNEAGIAAACDGVPAENIYLAARKVIENTEYIPYFYQSIGHGFGLFVHEHPFVRPMGTDILKAGNVTTCVWRDSSCGMAVMTVLRAKHPSSVVSTPTLRGALPILRPSTTIGAPEGTLRISIWRLNASLSLVSQPQRSINAAAAAIGAKNFIGYQFPANAAFGNNFRG